MHVHAVGAPPVEGDSPADTPAAIHSFNRARVWTLRVMSRHPGFHSEPPSVKFTPNPTRMVRPMAAPLQVSATLTPTPAAPRTAAVAAKSLPQRAVSQTAASQTLPVWAASETGAISDRSKSKRLSTVKSGGDPPVK